MSSRTVISPAGETIEIVSNEDWCQIAGVEPGSLRMFGTATKSHYIRALWEHGIFTSKSGLASAEIGKYCNKHYGMSVVPARSSGIFTKEVNAPAFERKINNKRTYSIKLVALPEVWYRKLLDEIKADKKPAPIAPVQPDWLPPAPPTELAPVATDLAMAQAVATSLLNSVIEMVSQGPQSNTEEIEKLEAGIKEQEALLIRQANDIAILRTNLNDARDLAKALTQERDGLRERLAMTERNLSTVLKGESAAVVNTEISRRIQALMTGKPTQKGD